MIATLIQIHLNVHLGVLALDASVQSNLQSVHLSKECETSK